MTFFPPGTFGDSDCPDGKHNFVDAPPEEQELGGEYILQVCDQPRCDKKQYRKNPDHGHGHGHEPDLEEDSSLPRSRESGGCLFIPAAFLSGAGILEEIIRHLLI